MLSESITVRPHGSVLVSACCTCQIYRLHLPLQAVAVTMLLLYVRVTGPLTVTYTHNGVYVQDVFSAGCVLAEMFLDGKLLFDRPQVMFLTAT